MKARIEKGKIVKYSQIPDTVLANNKSYLNAKMLSNSELEEIGFYDVIVPDYDSVTEVIYDLHFDDAYPSPTPEDEETTREVFTYNKKTKVISETVAELKKQQISKLKRLAYDKLQPTDWYAIRKAENGTDIPSDVITERDAIRTSVTTKEGEIDALTTKASILKYDINF